jgi:hypothetical protein
VKVSTRFPRIAYLGLVSLSAGLLVPRCCLAHAANMNERGVCDSYRPLKWRSYVKARSITASRTTQCLVKSGFPNNTINTLSMGIARPELMSLQASHAASKRHLDQQSPPFLCADAAWGTGQEANGWPCILHLEKPAKTWGSDAFGRIPDLHSKFPMTPAERPIRSHDASNSY